MDLDPVPQPPEPKRRCFCCGRKYGTRQLARHLQIFLEQLNERLDAAAKYAGNPNGDNAGLGGAEMDVDDPGLGGAEMDVDAAVGAGRDTTPDFGEDEAWALADIDVGFADNHVPPYVEPEHIHELRQNPPVHIDDWPDPGSDLNSEPSEVNDPADGEPEFEEEPGQPVDHGLDALYEPDMGDERVRAAMDTELGDLADEEWMDLYSETISNKDKNTMRFLATCLRTHFSRQTYNELRYGPCEALDLPSKFVAYQRLCILAGLETRAYDCCVNSCCCFLGKYSDL
ncbi:hypothetical protein FRC08_009614 [Ceratobasidium sp. 394]|nr:hypothetical protein FRC08_009614 [Ceratobasidium sp. 394]